MNLVSFWKTPLYRSWRSISRRAREAKHEVVRLGSELRAEVAMRIRKQSDLESRMERDMGHFAQRVEHLATSTTNLNDDLRASRSTSQGKMSHWPIELSSRGGLSVLAQMFFLRKLRAALGSS